LLEMAPLSSFQMQNLTLDLVAAACQESGKNNFITRHMFGHLDQAHNPHTLNGTTTSGPPFQL